MKTYIFGAAIFLASLVALPTFAQTPDDYGISAPGSYCPTLSITMVRGARDISTNNQVSELQKFLSDYYDIDPEEIVTGFFGRITHGYVQQFQREQKLPTFGIVGSLTRTAIAKACGDNSTTQSSTNTQTSSTQNNVSLQNFITGHNVATADRINLVFVGINFASVDEFKATVAKELTWDGRPSYGGAGFGPFAIEPLRSNKDKFNIWYDPNIMTGANSDEISVEIANRKESIERSGLFYVVPIFLNQKVSNDDGSRFIINHSEGMGINLSSNSFSSLRKSDLYPRAVVVTLGMRLTDPSSLVHELGHSIFGLADEKTDGGYDYPGAVPRIHAPDCVATMADAQALWGDLVGQVDPFYTEWKQTLQQNGQWSVLFSPNNPAWERMDERMRTGYYYGQCYGDTNGRNVIRPTDLSIMNTSQIAVFGSVNRRQVETVLGFFSGTIPAPNLAPTITSFTANPTPVPPGKGTRISWEASNATSCSVTSNRSDFFVSNGATSGSQFTNALTSELVATLTCPGTSGNPATHTLIIPVTATPTLAPTLIFTANPSTVASGEKTTLMWSSTNATSCVAPDGGNALSGNVMAVLLQTNTYSVTCTGSGGSVTKSATVTVIPAPVVCTKGDVDGDGAISRFDSGLVMKQVAGLLTLTDAQSGRADINGDGRVDLPDSIDIGRYVARQITTFPACASGTTGLPVVVKPDVTLTASASPTSITSGGQSTITWSSANTAACHFSSAGKLDNTQLNGSRTVSPNTTTTYTIDCNDDFGAQVSRPVTVTVNQSPAPAPTVTVSANPTSVYVEQPTTIIWSSTDATSCSKDGVLLAATSGSTAMRWTTANTFTTSITCTGPGGSATKSVTVTVVPAPVACTKGDVDGDGRISASDQTKIMQYVVGLVTLTDAEKSRADVDGNGIVELVDSINIGKYIVGIITTFPACPAGTAGLPIAVATSGVNQTASAINAYNNAANAGVSQDTSNFRYIWSRDLQIGSPYPDDITALQTALTREGVYTGEITGGFYNQTFAAVKSFQQKYGIETTGFVGLITRTKLNALYSK